MSENEKSNLDEVILNTADNITATLAYWDKNLVCRYANKAFEEWFGKSPEEMIGKMTVPEVVGPLMYEMNLPHIKKALNGEKQVFERKIVVPSGESRDSIISYLPDVHGTEVRGFFVHIADITVSKLNEAEHLASTRAKDKEIIRSIIATHEKEREAVAAALRDSISQTFAYSKMMLQATSFKDQENEALKKIEKNIQEAMKELNTISDNLSLSAITLFGLSVSIQDYVADFRKQFKHQVQFTLTGDDVEDILLEDKISVFRIVQNFLLLLSGEEVVKAITITLDYTSSKINLTLAHNDATFKLSVSNLHYVNIQNRVNYYDGSLTERIQTCQYIMNIQLNISSA